MRYICNKVTLSTFSIVQYLMAHKIEKWPRDRGRNYCKLFPVSVSLWLVTWAIWAIWLAGWGCQCSSLAQWRCCGRAWRPDSGSGPGAPSSQSPGLSRWTCSTWGIGWWKTQPITHYILFTWMCCSQRKSGHRRVWPPGGGPVWSWWCPWPGRESWD